MFMVLFSFFCISEIALFATIAVRHILHTNGAIVRFYIRRTFSNNLFSKRRRRRCKLRNTEHWNCIITKRIESVGLKEDIGWGDDDDEV